MTNLPYNPQAFVPVQPKPVDSRTAMINELKANLGLLSLRDQDFAKSLIQSFNQYGLSEKQGYWVVKLLERIDAARADTDEPSTYKPEAAVLYNGTPGSGSISTKPAAPVAVQLDAGFSGIVELFNRAKAAGLANPKIRLETEGGVKVVLRMAGSSSKYAGQITVTDNKAYEARTYFGRIDTAGQYFPSAKACDDVTKLLKDMSANPAKMAALYGFKTSNCCFCGLHLKTSESVTMGYGPICAEKFGMPWGQHVETTYTKLTLEDAE